jgi:hypothetical protein
MADTADVDLVVNVEQKDISRVSVGQPVVISIYALPADTFFGVVDKIAPMADAGTGFVTFPVIIRLTEGPLDKVLPGMTASAAFAGDESAAPAAPSEVAPGATVTATVTAPVTATVTATAVPTEEAEPEATVEATAEPAEEATTPEPEAEATAEPEPSATPTASN